MHKVYGTERQPGTKYMYMYAGLKSHRPKVHLVFMLTLSLTPAPFNPQVSVVNFQLIGLDAAVEINGQDLTVKADVKRFEREEKGNTDFKEFMSTVAAGTASDKNLPTPCLVVPSKLVPDTMHAQY